MKKKKKKRKNFTVVYIIFISFDGSIFDLRSSLVNNIWKITSESLEKDLTIYISDENDNPITGIPFNVKLLTEENAESLQSYVDAIKDIDAQIAEYTKDYDFSTETEETGSEEESDALPVATKFSSSDVSAFIRNRFSKPLSMK